MTKNNSIGPFKAVGLLLNTVGTAAGVLDTSVQEGGQAISSTLQGVNTVMSGGKEALDIITRGAIEDLKTDQIIEDAERQVRIAQARAEAARIVATIDAVDTTAQ